jgi:hypothetical protein
MADEPGAKVAAAAAPATTTEVKPDKAENIQAKVNERLATCAPVEIDGKNYGITVSLEPVTKGGKRNKRKTRSKRSARKSHKSRRVFGGKRK